MEPEEARKKFLEGYQGQDMFLLGNEACTFGAIYGGCNFFAGYPISPANEIAETMSRFMPTSGGHYIQMEDEVGSIGSVIGAAWAGGRAMTATSGPGFSLMQENIGYAIMTETPCVIVDVQRSGPSTGQATKPAQGDVMQSRWGTHGDHEIIAISPNSAQECLDLMPYCFNLAERYRTPVIFLMDGTVGHNREKVHMPMLLDVNLVHRKKASGKVDAFGGELVPPMIEFGDGLDVHITGSSHHANGMRDVVSQPVHDTLVRRLYQKIDGNRDDIIKVEIDIGGSGNSRNSSGRIGIISYGATSRPARGAALKARAEGIDVDLLRPITIWPFARKEIEEFCGDKDVILVCEMNLGQLSREVERFAHAKVVPISKIGGVGFTIDEILKEIRGVA